MLQPFRIGIKNIALDVERLIRHRRVLVHASEKTFTFAQRLFKMLALGDINDDPKVALSIPIRVKKRFSVPRNPRHLALFRHKAALPVPGQSCRGCRIPSIKHRLLVIRVQCLTPALSQGFIRCQPGDITPAWINKNAIPLRISLENTGRRMVSDDPIPRFALAQIFLCLLALGDVLAGSQGADDAAVLVADAAVVPGDQALITTADANRVLVVFQNAELACQGLLNTLRTWSTSILPGRQVANQSCPSNSSSR